MPSLAVCIIIAAVLLYSFEMTEQSLRFPGSESSMHGCLGQPSSHVHHRHKRATHMLCQNMCEGDLSSFSQEEMLEERFGRRVNITRLVNDYSLICPLDDTCAGDIDRSLVYNGSRDHDAFKDCPKCTCDSTCATNNTCCPGSYFGYIEHECTNLRLYPINETFSNNIVALVGQCVNTSTGNTTLHDMCTGKLQPCYVDASCLSYRNKYCALCNGETKPCVKMDLITECPVTSYVGDDYRQSLSTHKGMRTFITNNGCRVTYRFEGNPVECKLDDEPKISKCNSTGLWSEYDEEIDWACQNFRTPYGKFKNVFCYICNPSLANIRNATLKEECPDQTTTPIPDILIEKCDILPSIARMFPYKNIYCFACQFRNASYSFEFGSVVIRNEAIDLASMSINVKLYINIFGANLEDMLLSVLGKYFNKFTPIPDSSLLDHPISTNAYIDEHFNEIMDEYMVVCASRSTNCYSQNTSDHDYVKESYSNKVCEVSSCSCENECVSLFTCCPEFVLQRQPYSILMCAVNDVNQIGLVDYVETMHLSTECDDSWHQENKVIVISTCLAGHHNETIRNKCESMDFDADILKYLPVSNGGRVAYRNIYCLVCNNENGIPVTSATISLGLQCNNLMELVLVYTLEEVLDLVNLHCDKFNFLPESQRGYFSSDVRDYNGSYTYQYTDQKITKIFHLISSKIYDKCNITGGWIDENSVVQRTCEDVTANILALKPYKYSGIYKNFACFVCNPRPRVRSDTISECNAYGTDDRNNVLVPLCNATTSHPSWVPYKNFYCAECNQYDPLIPVTITISDRYIYIPLYKYIFRLSATDFMEMIHPSMDIKDCENGLFNQVLGKCQQKYCFEGYVLENDVCTNSVESAINNLFYLEFTVRLASNSSTMYSQIYLHDLLSKISDKIYTVLNFETDFFIESVLFRAEECSYIHNMTETRPVYVGMMVDVMYSPDILSDKLALFGVTQSSYSVKRAGDNDVEMIGLESYKDHERALPLLPKVCMRRVYARPILIESPMKPIFQVVDKFLFCPMVRFTKEECSLNVLTQTLTIHSVNWTLENHLYRFDNQFAYICEDNFITFLKHTKQTSLKSSEPFRITPPLEDALNTTTFVCTLLSIGCMFLSFITYCIFPKLREKVIGKSNMILCLVLSLAQGFLQFGIEKTEYGFVCSTIGALLHFFLMCSYCTMNVCSFNMFKIFYMNRLIRERRTKFSKYMVYIVLYPLTLVGAVIMVNLIRSDGAEIGYGKEYCFISDFYQMVALFCLPSAVIFLSNMCLFALAFYAIRSAPSISGKQDKRDFFLYVKLCSVVGLTWPALIVDNLIGLTWFSFVASGLNALQGVFIFFSYVINKRVVYLYRGLILESKTSQTPS